MNAPKAGGMMCAMCGMWFLMQTTRFQRPQVLIVVPKLLSDLKKHYKLWCLVYSHRYARNDPEPRSNVWVAMVLYVQCWHRILDHHSRYKQNRPSTSSKASCIAWNDQFYLVYSVITNVNANLFLYVHQQNVFWSLGASGSVWELSDQNPRVVKSQSVLDRCSGLQVHLGAPRTADNKPWSTWVRPRQAWERRPKAWKRQQQAWEHIESQ
jgi:hypothetical protein